VAKPGSDTGRERWYREEGGRGGDSRFEVDGAGHCPGERIEGRESQRAEKPDLLTLIEQEDQAVFMRVVNPVSDQFYADRDLIWGPRRARSWVPDPSGRQPPSLGFAGGPGVDYSESSTLRYCTATATAPVPAA
jgi:hypothetical protein